jgi:hypothetical protein
MKGGHGPFNYLPRLYVNAVQNYFKNYPENQRIEVYNNDNKLTGYKNSYSSESLITFQEMKDAILQLQTQVKELEEKMKNNSNTGSVSTTQTFFSANSKGGKRKTQKKRKV